MTHRAYAAIVVGSKSSPDLSDISAQTGNLGDTDSALADDGESWLSRSDRLLSYDSSILDILSSSALPKDPSVRNNLDRHPPLAVLLSTIRPNIVMRGRKNPAK
jgi:hypothetical protein